MNHATSCKGPKLDHEAQPQKCTAMETVLTTQLCILLANWYIIATIMT